MTEDIQGLLAELEHLAELVAQRGDDPPLALACQQLREALEDQGSEEFSAPRVKLHRCRTSESP
jgi:hypothetical protein